MKKIILKTPKKVGRKSNESKGKTKARNQNVSFPVEMHDFIHGKLSISGYIQERVNLDEDYQNYLETLKPG